VKTIQVPFTVNTIYTPNAPKQGEADVTVYEHIMDAVEQLGEDKVLDMVNYAQRLADMRAARSRFICLHEGPEKRKVDRMLKRKKA
jgi:hypothetical protein